MVIEPGSEGWEASVPAPRTWLDEIGPKALKKHLKQSRPNFKKHCSVNFFSFFFGCLCLFLNCLGTYLPPFLVSIPKWVNSLKKVRSVMVFTLKRNIQQWMLQNWKHCTSIATMECRDRSFSRLIKFVSLNSNNKLLSSTRKRFA